MLCHVVSGLCCASVELPVQSINKVWHIVRCTPFVDFLLPYVSMTMDIGTFDS